MNRQLTLKRECPACRLGKFPSGARCSTCEGKGEVLTLLGVEIRQLIEEVITERYGKSIVDSVAKVSTSDKAKAPQTHQAPISNNGSQAKNLPGSPAFVPPKPPFLPNVPVKAEPRRTPQAGPWSLP